MPSVSCFGNFVSGTRVRENYVRMERASSCRVDANIIISDWGLATAWLKRELAREARSAS